MRLYLQASGGYAIVKKETFLDNPFLDDETNTLPTSIFHDLYSLRKNTGLLRTLHHY